MAWIDGLTPAQREIVAGLERRLGMSQELIHESLHQAGGDWNQLEQLFH
jgi:hypothetical protein